MTAQHPRRLRERAAALVTVLVMVSIMSALAIVVVDAARYALRRTANQAGVEQARWLLLGAESLAVDRVQELAQRAESERIDSADWQGRDMTFPTDYGVMTVSLWDASNCFNLNSLVETSSDGAFSINALGAAQFARLLDVLSVRSTTGASLVPPLVDWLDSDDERSPGGAESESYQSAGAPYQTSNRLLGDIGELLSVNGFNAGIVGGLAPYACVRPTTGASQINPNTLMADQAPVLAMLLGRSTSIADARDIIARRPHGGWQSIDEFFSETAFRGVELTDAGRAQFSLKSRYYVGLARIQNADISETSVFLIDAGGAPRIVRRVYGAGAAGRYL